MLSLQERHPFNLGFQGIEKVHQTPVTNMEPLNPQRQRRRLEWHHPVEEVGLDARFVFLLANRDTEFAVLECNDSSVVCGYGAEGDERVPRILLRPGAAGAGFSGEELLEAVLELIKVISKDKAGGAAGGEVVAEVDECVGVLSVRKSNQKLWS